VNRCSSGSFFASTGNFFLLRDEAGACFALGSDRGDGQPLGTNLAACGSQVCSMRHVDESLQIICGELERLPGLRLTLRDAVRRWSIDQTRMHAMLEALVDTGWLRVLPDGTYASGAKPPATSIARGRPSGPRGLHAADSSGASRR